MPYNVGMRTWHLKAGDPLSLILACDARTSQTDYVDDQIWELSLGGGDPPALGLHTTYGLRARLVRIFLRFSEGDQSLSNPEDFFEAPELHKIYPNFIELKMMPFKGIEVIAEFWVPNSQAIAGRVTISNRSDHERTLYCEVVGQLSSNDGQRFAPFEMTAATLLSGSTSGLSPVLFVTGGAKAGKGPYPSLRHKYHLALDEKRQFVWVNAALRDREASFDLTREITALNWEAVKSRIEMLNAGLVEIITGDPDWDAAFMLAQKAAANLIIGPTDNLPHPSFAFTRQIDQGYSLQGDGSDYNHLWNGQTVFDTKYLLDIILPGLPEIAQNIVRNFFSVQDANGFIDFKPSLGGQKHSFLTTPLLANLVWRVFEQTNDLIFLEECFDPLCRYINYWFSQDHDRDQDGFPEWSNPMQTGLEYHPIYSRWQSASLGVDISVTESPALGAMLFSECERLIQMGELLKKTQEIEQYFDLVEQLKSKVEATWDETENCYLDRDRDTHISPHGHLLLDAKGSGYFPIRQKS